MRIGGLASGMDIDSLVGKLMKAERMPLNRMQQESTTLTWKRDAFRDVNKALFELENMTLGMEYGSTYNAKSVSSSNESAVTATASSDASNGSYNINVERLASSAINISQSELNIDPNKTFKEQNISNTGTFEFFTYAEDGTKNPAHEFTVDPGDTLNDVLKDITKKDNNVRAFYDSQSKKVVLETTRTGDYNQTDNYLGAEIGFNGQSNSSFFTDTLDIKNGEYVDADENGATDGVKEWKKLENGGINAKFTYNGELTIESKNNSYTLNDVNFDFKGKGTARLNVTNDVEASFDKIIKFIDKYNQTVEKLNDTQQEEIYRDYKPLTTKQKKEMSESEIKLWEEKAKSGILQNESAISGGLFDLRRSWYENVDTGVSVEIGNDNPGELTSITQIGITTTRDFTDGGKLIVEPKKLKEALREDPDGVYKLFSNDAKGDTRGVINRLEDSLEQTMEKIGSRAGRGEETLESYTIGKRMGDLNDRIAEFEDRLVRVENRYWSQFSQMEQAIQRMNQQSAQLMSQFGGGA
ncbi:flagellar hook-associated protein 2 [Virgibacillus sp. L01]|uniref:flagellar hook-associated protein 2 n=1 Tax=Virgibacillus sp. L01 TaxID=3457429 RepID=UPI003FD45D8B